MRGAPAFFLFCAAAGAGSRAAARPAPGPPAVRAAPILPRPACRLVWIRPRRRPAVRRFARFRPYH